MEKKESIARKYLENYRKLGDIFNQMADINLEMIRRMEVPRAKKSAWNHPLSSQLHCKIKGNTMPTMGNCSINRQRPYNLSIKLFSTFSYCVIIIMINSMVHAQPTVEITNYYQNKQGAITYTFDDGSQSQYDIGVANLDKHGFNGTFLVISGITRDKISDDRIIDHKHNWGAVSWEEWKIAHDNGHDIGCHGKNHVGLTKIRGAELKEEITHCRKAMEEKLGITPVSMAYPYNSVNAEVEKIAYDTYLWVRESQRGFGSSSSLSQMNNAADNAVKNKVWETIMIHGIDEEYSPLSSQFFKDHLEYCKKLSDDGKLWVGNFAAVNMYADHKKSTTIKVLSRSKFEVEFSAASDAVTTNYNHPLTFKIGPVNPAPKEVLAKRSGEKLNTKIAGNTILVDALPSAVPIKVQWGDLPVVVSYGNRQQDSSIGYKAFLGPPAFAEGDGSNRTFVDVRGIIRHSGSGPKQGAGVYFFSPGIKARKDFRK